VVGEGAGVSAVSGRLEIDSCIVVHKKSSLGKWSARAAAWSS
jgi:hypothetical protein